MIVSSLDQWLEANQRYLMAALAELRQILEQQVGSSGDRSVTISSQNLEAMAAAMRIPSAVETLCHLFNLSPFERQVLLLCAGVELDGEIAKLCGQLQGAERKNYATFSLALSVLPNSYWSEVAQYKQEWQTERACLINHRMSQKMRLDKNTLLWHAQVTIQI